MTTNDYKQLHNGNEKKKSSFSFRCFKYFIAFYILSAIIANLSNNREDIYTASEYAALLLSENDTDKIINILEKKFDIEIEEDRKDEFLLLNSILSNNQLNENIKSVFYKYYSIIEDCIYMNRNEAYKSLKNVSVNYTERGPDVKESVLGDYDYNNGNGIINIYSADSENKILIHEGIHCLFYNPITEKLPEYFTEGVTELLANEYFSEDPFYESETYYYEIAYVKMLNELVGSDLILESFCKGDFSIVTNYMDRYNDTEFSSSKILNVYEDKFTSIEKGVDDNYNYSEKNYAYKALEKIFVNMHKDFKGYDAFKYFHELSGSIFEKDPSSYYGNYIGNYGILEKGYFSNSLKQEYFSTTFKSYSNRDKVFVKTRF